MKTPVFARASPDSPLHVPASRADQAGSWRENGTVRGKYDDRAFVLFTLSEIVTGFYDFWRRKYRLSGNSLVVTSLTRVENPPTDEVVFRLFFRVISKQRGFQVLTA
jgi:hypothetical protein